MEQLSLNIIVP